METTIIIILQLICIFIIVKIIYMLYNKQQKFKEQLDDDLKILKSKSDTITYNNIALASKSLKLLNKLDKDITFINQGEPDEIMFEWYDGKDKEDYYMLSCYNDGDMVYLKRINDKRVSKQFKKFEDFKKYIENDQTRSKSKDIKKVI